MGEAIRRIGGYEIIAKLGSGTAGTVYKARQLAMDRLVALKILNSKLLADRASVNKFIEEAKAAGRINHGNLCQVYEVASEGGGQILYVDRVPGPAAPVVLSSPCFFIQLRICNASCWVTVGFWSFLSAIHSDA